MGSRSWIGRLVVFTIGVASVVACAQDKALITGDVVNEHDRPLAGIIVVLQNDQLGVRRVFTTDSDGTYFFASVEAADGYRIVAGSGSSGMTFAPDQILINALVGEQRYVLPSFIAEVSPPLSSIAPVPHDTGHHLATVSMRTQVAGHPSVALATVTHLPGTSRGVLPAVFVEPNSRQVPRYTFTAASASASGQETNGSQNRQTPAASATTATHSAPGGLHTQTEHRIVLDNLSVAMSDVITSSQLRTLPLYNRNFLVLGPLSASTFNVPAGSELAGATFGVSGQGPISNNFLIDGMNNVASSNNQAIPFQVNEAIREFRVVYATPEAQYGHATGGVVNIVTQRGTANFHGSVFGYFGSDSLNAGTPLSIYNGSGFDQAANYAGTYTPVSPQNVGLATKLYLPQSYNQYAATAQAQGMNCATPGATKGSANCYQAFDPAAVLAAHDSHTQPISSQQFGARAGGRVFKKWYWFGDYEDTRIDNPNPIFDRVPTSFDLSRASVLFPEGNQSAAIAHSLLSLYPQSNVVAVPGALEFYQGQAPNYTNVDNYMTRFDFTQSANTSWSARYNIQDLHQLHDDTLPSSSVYPGNGSVRSVLNQNLSLTLTHYFSDKLINELRGGFTRFQVIETPQDQNFNALAVGLSSGALSTFLLSGLDPQYSGARPGVNGAMGGWDNSAWIPSAAQNPPSTSPMMSPSLDGLFPFPRLGAPLDSPSQRRDSAFEALDNVSVFRGRHSIKFGVEYRNLQDIYIDDALSRGLVVSGNIGEFTSDSESCNSPGCQVAAFTNPSFDYALRQQAPYRGLFQSFVAAGYAQDVWRVKSHLALSFGLRYEYFSPPSEVNDQTWNYDPVANGLVQQGHGQVVDPFGYNCSTGYSAAAFIYPANPVYLPWRCQNTASGSFLLANSKQFEPRIGVVWSNADASTVVRAGFGIFYAQLPSSQIAQLMFNRPTVLSESSPQAIYGQNFNSFYCGSAVVGQTPGQCGLGNSSLNGINPASQFYQISAEPFGISAIDSQHMNSPQSRQVSASLQRLLTDKLSVQVGYVGNYMQQLPTVSNTGFNNEWFCTNSAGSSYPNMPASNASNCDSFSYFPILTRANRGYGSYNALILEVSTNGWHGLQASASYTFSKALDNSISAEISPIPTSLMSQLYGFQFYGLGNPSVFGLGNTTQFTNSGINITPGAYTQSISNITSLLTQGVTTTGAGQVYASAYSVPQDPYNSLRNDYGRSDLNTTSRFILHFVWDIPWARRSRWMGGWSLSGIFTAESGQPFTIFAGSMGGELSQRADITGALGITGNPNQYFSNMSAITSPSAACAKIAPANSWYVIGQTLFDGTAGSACVGTSARNQFTGPAYVDFDMAAQKAFKTSERTELVFRSEFYNLFNRSNFYNPISNYSLDGVTPNPEFGEIKSARSPRQIQLAVRLNW